MLLLKCPHCIEARSEEEFDYAGEAHIQRPAPGVSDAEWADYLYCRSNPRGRHREMWVHTAGCRRYFNVVRDTVSYEILAAYPIGEREGGPLAGEPSAGEREGGPLARREPSAGEREGGPLARREPSAGEREGGPLANRDLP